MAPEGSLSKGSPEVVGGSDGLFGAVVEVVADRAHLRLELNRRDERTLEGDEEVPVFRSAIVPGQGQARPTEDFSSPFDQWRELLGYRVLEGAQVLAAGDGASGARVQVARLDLALSLQVPSGPERSHCGVETVEGTHAATLSARRP